MSIGHKILEVRKRKGISQEALATDLQIAQSSISNYESGITKPDIDTLKKMANYFELPISELISDENYTFYNHKNKGDNIGNVVINELSDKLFTQFEKRLEEKEAIIQLLKETIDKQNKLLEQFLKK